jgi:DNA-binding LytR/AlgR family response regulator
MIISHKPTIIICNLFFDGNPKGLDLLQLFSARSRQFIIITSSLESSFYEATNKLGAGSHLVKPFHPLTLRSTIDTIVSILPALTVAKDPYLFIRGSKNKQVRIDFSDILYLYSERNYTFVKTSDALHTIKRSLTKMQQELDARFLRVHNSYIVNADLIKSVAPMTLLINKEIVPVGRAYRKNLSDRLKLKRQTVYPPAKQAANTNSEWDNVFP